jgi:hypothetical protein
VKLATSWFDLMEARDVVDFRGNRKP